MWIRLNCCLVAVVLLLNAGAAMAAFEDGARFAFVQSAALKEIYVIDLHNRTLAHTIKLESTADAVAASAQLKALVISHRAESRLTLVDLSSEQLVAIDYPLGLTPSYVAVDPTGEMIAVHDREAGRLEVHSLRRREVLLAADDVNSETELTFSTDGARLYWTDGVEGTFNSIDLWSRRTSIELAPGNSRLSAASRSIDGSLAFISDGTSNKVHLVNLTDFEPLAQIRVGDQPGRPWGTSDGRYMLVPNEGDGTISAISVWTGKPSYSVRAVENPSFISPGWIDTTAAVVGRSGEVAFVDVETGKVSDRYALGGTPATGVVTSDSRTLAIPVQDENRGRIVFFDMRERTMISEVDGLGSELGAAALAISNNLCH